MFSEGIWEIMYHKTKTTFKISYLDVIVIHILRWELD